MQHRDICKVSIREAEEGAPKDDKYERIETIISSGTVDGHGTFMTERTLKNFAESLNKKDIQFKDSHKQGQGFGVSEGGSYEDGVVRGQFKLMRNWQLNDASLPNSDQFIEGIREGIITKTSVGFSGGDFTCQICDSDFFGRSCSHYPNMKYEIENEKGIKETVTCTLAIDNARLNEVSAVSAGSNQDAVIMEKAQRDHREGTLPVEVKNRLEMAYGVRFDDGKTIKTETGDDNMELKEVQEQLDAVTTERDEAQTKVEELTPLAECGRAAREHQAKLALEAYKVSRGEHLQDSDVENAEKRFAKLSFSDLVVETDHLRSIAPEKPEIEPGSKTEQPDNSGNEKREEKVVSLTPPWYGRTR